LRQNLHKNQNLDKQINSFPIPEEIPQKFPKNSPKFPKKYPPKYPKISKKIQELPKNSQDFKNIQFLTSHLEAENPFGLVFFKFLKYYHNLTNSEVRD
jgi:hypothetical protein